MSKRHSAGTINPESAATVALALVCTLVSASAHADPPHGGDAPGSFADAWPIDPITFYGGDFDRLNDVDYYKFSVAAWQDIEIVCGAITIDENHGYVRSTCYPQLWDPAGNFRADIYSSGNSYAVALRADLGGDWRLRVANGDPHSDRTPIPYEARVTLKAPQRAGTGVAVDESGGTTFVVEGGASDRYTLALTSPPTTEVIVAINAGPDLRVNPSSVTFTTTDFSEPHTVTVSAVDDAIANYRRISTISHTASSADVAYAGIPIGSVRADITDDDVPAIVVTESEGSTEVAEDGATDAYFIALTRQPARDVTVTVDADSQLQVRPLTLTFTPANFDEPQAVAVGAIDDALVQGTHANAISHQASSADGAYDKIWGRNVTVWIADNDSTAAGTDTSDDDVPSPGQPSGVGQSPVQPSTGGGAFSWLTLTGLLALGRLRHRRYFAALCGAGLLGASSAALADPPAGADAPGSFDEAVRIAPGSYRGSYELPADTDVYKFDVATGQDVEADCFQHYHTPHPVFFVTDIPCVAHLIDPQGIVRASSATSFTLISVGAEAGQWRLRVDGANLHDPLHSPLAYRFAIRLPGSSATISPLPDAGAGDDAESPPPGGDDGGGGGPLAPAVTLLFGAMALLRRACRARTAIGPLAALLALTSAPVRADPPYNTDYDAPETFADAVLVASNTVHAGTTASAGDIDFYKFDVAQGQDIYFSCSLEGTHVSTRAGFYEKECVSSLIDPAGNERDSAPPSFTLHVGNAGAGQWRVRINNGVPGNPASARYFLLMDLQSAGSAAGGGGALGLAVCVPFGALALMRRRRKVVRA
jgi:hypothetical protein